MKSNRIGLLLFILLNLTTFLPNLNAQSKSEPGFIVMLNGDTLHGFINNKDWRYNPSMIEYKAMQEESWLSLTPDSILSFEVLGNRFQSRNIKINKHSNLIDDLNYQSEIETSEIKAFVKCLFVGDKSLYMYENQINVNYYIEIDGNLVLLEHKRFLLKIPDQDNKVVVSSKNKFAGQLIVYFDNNPSLRNKFNNLTYTLNRLSDLFTEYYADTQKIPAYQAKQVESTLHGGAMIGINQSQVSFSSDNHYYLDGVSFSKDYKPIVGAFVDFNFPQKFKQLSISVEAFYHSYKISAYHYRKLNSIEWVENTNYMDMHYLKTNLLLRYNYPIVKTRLFVEGGFSVGLVLKSLLERVETYSFNGNPTTQTLPLFSYPKNTETGWLLGLGIGYDRWALGCRYERTNSVSNNHNVGSVATYYHLMLKVNLF